MAWAHGPNDREVQGGRDRVGGDAADPSDRDVGDLASWQGRPTPRVKHATGREGDILWPADGLGRHRDRETERQN
jgi:hypothetical protein